VGEEEEVGVDDLFSTKGWRCQKSDSADGDDGDSTICVLPMTKLAARWKGKPIFDKQDRFVHPAAIAKNDRRKKNNITFPHSS
jgi:hypothetical protein